MPGTRTESRIVQILNDHYKANDIKAKAHRLKMGGYAPQHIDVLSLSDDLRYYLGIECKSALKIDINGRPFDVLYYTRYFTTSKKDGSSQVTRTEEYLEKCGLHGYLAFELRAGQGYKNRIWFVPFEKIVYNYEAGQPGMHIEEISKYPDILEVGVEGVLC